MIDLFQQQCRLSSKVSTVVLSKWFKGIPKSFVVITIIIMTIIMPQQQTNSYSFTNIKSQSLFQNKIISCSNYNRNENLIKMRDMSSANVFQIGDRVKVVSSVFKAGIDLKGKVGIVKETWEKCEVDPTCCCAEFVDENFAVYVQFSNGDGDNSIDISSDGQSLNIVGLNDYYTHYFAEEELVKVLL